MLVKGYIEYESEKFQVEIDEVALAVDLISTWDREGQPSLVSLECLLEEQVEEAAENSSSAWELQISNIDIDTRFTRDFLTETLAKAYEILERPVIRIHKDQLTLGIE